MPPVLQPLEGDVVRACYGATTDAVTLRDRVLARLQRLVPTDAAFFALLDPETLLFTTTWADAPLRASGPRFIENEFAEAVDVNRFAVLARARLPVATLDGATRGEWRSSARWREIMAPLGLGDELRAVLRVAGSAWGVLCLHRAGSTTFSAREAEIVRRIGPHLAEAIRRLAAVTTSGASPGGDREGVVVVDRGVIAGITDGAASLLNELGHGARVGDAAPLLLLALVRRLEALERGDDSGAVPAATLSTPRGALLGLHAARLRGSSGSMSGAVAVTLAPPTLDNRIAMRMAAYRFTPAQRRVAALLVKGCSTKEMTAVLQVGGDTIQDHLKAIFARTGVRTRRELVSALLR